MMRSIKGDCDSNDLPPFTPIVNIHARSGVEGGDMKIQVHTGEEADTCGDERCERTGSTGISTSLNRALIEPYELDRAY